jgi:hypothetical protein
VQESAARGQGYRCDGAIQSLGANIGSFEWVDSDIHCLAVAASEFLTYIKHGSFVHLAFADDHCSGDLHGVEGAAHRFCGGVICGHFVTFANPAAA